MYRTVTHSGLRKEKTYSSVLRGINTSSSLIVNSAINTSGSLNLDIASLVSASVYMYTDLCLGNCTHLNKNFNQGKKKFIVSFFNFATNSYRSLRKWLIYL